MDSLYLITYKEVFYLCSYYIYHSTKDMFRFGGGHFGFVKFQGSVRDEINVLQLWH